MPISGGQKEEVHFDEITTRIQKLCYGLSMDFVDPVSKAGQLQQLQHLEIEHRCVELAHSRSH